MGGGFTGTPTRLGSVDFGQVFTISGTVITGNAYISGLATTLNLYPGMNVSGVGAISGAIPANTIISSILSSSAVSINSHATSTSSGNITFYASATVPSGIVNGTWTARSAAEANQWNCVTFGNGLFVAVAGDGTSRVMTSPDGITWTARTAAAALNWQGVVFGKGLFVAVSHDLVSNSIMTSPDGITWTARTAAEANLWTSVTFANGLFVAVGESGTNRVMTSPDGITWTSRTPEANDWQDVTYGNGLFVAVANAGTNRVTTSRDG